MHLVSRFRPRRLRNPRRGALWGAALRGAALLAVGCDSCGCGSSLAELVETEGDVSRDFDRARLQWVEANVGESFQIGDGIRTRAGASARVALAGGGGLQLVENTIVRFLEQDPGSTTGQVSVDVGEAALTAGEEGLAVRGTFGLARISPGSQMRISATEGQMSFEVLIGSARIEGDAMETVELQAGDPEILLDLELGAPVFEEVAQDAGPGDAGAPDAGTDAAPPPEVVSVEARGVVQLRGEDGTWARLDSGSGEVPVGSTVRLRPRARLVLRRGEDTLTVMGPAEMQVLGTSDRYVNLSGGRAQSHVVSEDLGIGVPGGGVVGRAGAGGTQHEIGIRGGTTDVQVARGSTELHGAAGERFVLRSGQSASITSAGAIEVENRAPARAHIAVAAGTSASIHDPSAPVAVQLRFAGACPGEGVIEIGRGARAWRSFGVGQANVLLSPGRHRYAVRCAEAGTPRGSPVATGTLSILRDSGRAMLPVRPPRNVVDTDGRRYKLLYQNLLPIVVVRWPQATGTAPYTLVLETNGGTKRVESNRPQATLESGDVPEGIHRIYFESGGGRSPVTTLAVGYDNAATAVFLREPGTAPITGSSVAVSGIALEGWSVNVGGMELPLDNQFRFSGTAPVPSNVDAVAIRLTHPRHGAHYYLRRIAR